MNLRKPIKHQRPPLLVFLLSLLLAGMPAIAQEETGAEPAGENLEQTGQTAETPEENGDASAAEAEEAPADNGAAELPAEGRPVGERRVRPIDSNERARQLQRAQQNARSAETGTATEEDAVAATEPDPESSESPAAAPQAASPEDRAQALRDARNGRATPVPNRGAGRRVPAGADPARGAVDNSAEVSQSRIVTMREHLAQFYENQRQISKEWSEFELARRMLEGRIQIMKDQIERIKEQTEERRGTIQEADREKAEKADKNQMLSDLNTYQRRQIKALEDNMRILYQKLPSPLKTQLSGLADRIPPREATSEEIETSVSARYATVIGMLSQIDKFNRAIHVEPETMEVAEGEEKPVDVIYLGIGQAYYVQTGNPNGAAGHGVPGPEGWVWTRDDALAPRLTQMIAIFNNEGTAQYTGLPATIE